MGGYGGDRGDKGWNEGIWGKIVWRWGVCRGS